MCKFRIYSRFETECRSGSTADCIICGISSRYGISMVAVVYLVVVVYLWSLRVYEQTKEVSVTSEKAVNKSHRETGQPSLARGDRYPSPSQHNCH